MADCEATIRMLDIRLAIAVSLLSKDQFAEYIKRLGREG